MKVIIAAAGHGHRWGGHLGIRKHQAPIDGMPILQRLIDQFTDAGVRPVVLCHPDHPYDYPGADYTTITPDDTSSIAKISSSHHLWCPHGRTLVVFGDVYFSPAGFAALLPDPPHWTVYGRIGRSRYSRRKRHSLFGLSFSPDEHDQIWSTCVQIAQLDRAGEIPSGGRLLYWYQHVTGQPLHPTMLTDEGHWVQISDETDDVDKPSHYEMLRRAVRAADERRERALTPNS